MGVLKQGTPLGLRFLKACSISLPSEAGSILQKEPFPGSSWERATLMKYRFRDRLWRIEFWTNIQYHWILYMSDIITLHAKPLERSNVDVKAFDFVLVSGAGLQEDLYSFCLVILRKHKHDYMLHFPDTPEYTVTSLSMQKETQSVYSATIQSKSSLWIQVLLADEKINIQNFLEVSSPSVSFVHCIVGK